MQIRQALSEGVVLLDLKAVDVKSAIVQVLDRLVDRGHLTSDQRRRAEAALMAREESGSTAIGDSIAVPHAHLDDLQWQDVAFVRLARPMNLGAPDGVPTRFLFVLLGPTGRATEHLEALMSIARLMGDEDFRSDALEARSREELVEAYERFRDRNAPGVDRIPPPRDEGLKPSGRIAGGLIGDVRRRLPHYLDDFRDGLHPKALASTLFLFFACLAPSVAFGGVMALMTDGQIGVIEMLVSTAACGVTFALLGGQPLALLGGTGPLLVFTAMLYSLCDRLGLPFLPTYAWVGLWTCGMTLLLAVVDASCLIRFFTRFTDEIFAGLISLIFIYEAVNDLAHVFTDRQVSYATALLSLVLAVGTYQVAMGLAHFRRSPYLRPRIREAFADFGPAIAVGAMAAVAFSLHEVELPRLAVPRRFDTTSDRPWLVDPMAVPGWVRLASAGPALLATLLVFLDHQITARLVNNPDHRLHRGSSHHLDLAVVGGMIGVCSMFGLPWVVAATVRSLNHVRSLATVEEVDAHGGEPRDRIIHVRENRVSPLAIHAMIGLSLLMLPLLRQVPMAVLFGLFLFMGVASMSGNQLFERLKLWLMEPALYPATHYIRRVPLRTIHLYTMIQLGCLVVLWVVKASPMGLLFPLFIALLVPVRLFLLPRLIAPRKLAIIDAEEGAGAEVGEDRLEERPRPAAAAVGADP